MAISFVAAASASANTVTLPAFQAGDLAIVFAYRSGNSGLPTVPAGWTPYKSISSGLPAAGRLAYRWLVTGDTTTGVFTNSIRTLVAIYRSPVGIEFQDVPSASPSGFTVGTSTSATYAAIAAAVLDPTSWCVGFIGTSVADGANETPPTGMVLRLNGTNVCLHDTNGAVTSWAQQIVAMGGTSGGWMTSVLQLVERAARQINPVPQYLAH